MLLVVLLLLLVLVLVLVVVVLLLLLLLLLLLASAAHHKPKNLNKRLIIDTSVPVVQLCVDELAETLVICASKSLEEEDTDSACLQGLFLVICLFIYALLH